MAQKKEAPAEVGWRIAGRSLEPTGSNPAWPAGQSARVSLQFQKTRLGLIEFMANPCE
jgi:hypothetical protein